MKPTTAYDVAAAAIDYVDARAARIESRRTRNAAIAAFADGEKIDSRSEECQAATATEHHAYRASVSHESATKNRLRAAVARAKKELKR